MGVCQGVRSVEEVSVVGNDVSIKVLKIERELSVLVVVLVIYVAFLPSAEDSSRVCEQSQGQWEQEGTEQKRRSQG